MAYSTGAGDYNALLDAVLTHAVADGWTESAGVGTGWPIISPSGRVRGVGYSSFTLVEDDHTFGGDGVSKTRRYVRLGLGVSGAEASANAALPQSPKVPNMGFTFTGWHIFSDISLNEHIHVVVEFNNGATPQVFTHFSFGEIDKSGMTYNSIAYATTSDKRAYAVGDDGASPGQETAQSGGDWNTLTLSGLMFGGTIGRPHTGFGEGSTAFITHSTSAPHPSAAAGWPAHDTMITRGQYLLSKISNFGLRRGASLTSSDEATFADPVWARGLNSQTGFVPLAPIPFILMNGELRTSRARWCGVFPNVRFCSVEGISPGDEFTFGTDVWKCFPMLRPTPWSLIGQRYQITSGYAGYAYKKVT